MCPFSRFAGAYSLIPDILYKTACPSRSLCENLHVGSETFISFPSRISSTITVIRIKHRRHKPIHHDDGVTALQLPSLTQVSAVEAFLAIKFFTEN